MDELMKWMNNGLAVVLVVGGCVAGVYIFKLIIAGIKHLFSEVVVPMKNAGIEHLKQTDTMMRSNEETNRQISDRLQALNSNVETIGTDVLEIKTGMREWNESA